jgi:gamma-glutamyltranspeptidase / glutathione hydrolase
MTRVAVATSSRLAADAACEIADRGGNAVDCAIAASLLTMNTEPGVCALAGGAYVTVWAAGGKPVTIDGNVAIPGIGLEHAADPAAAVPLHMEYGGGIDTLVGCGSVAVPGSLAALEKVSCEFGLLDWRELFLPTIRAVDTGFPLPPAGHYYLQFSGMPVFGRSKDGFKALHYPDGSLRDTGDPIKVPHLADSLRAIAAGGSRVFYEGEIAQAMVRHVQENGGSMTRNDLLRYSAIVRDSLTVSLDGWRIGVNPPPAIGGAVLAAMLLAFRHQPGGSWNTQSLRALVAVQEPRSGIAASTLISAMTSAPRQHACSSWPAKAICWKSKLPVRRCIPLPSTTTASDVRLPHRRDTVRVKCRTEQVCGSTIVLANWNSTGADSAPRRPAPDCRPT